MQRQPESRGPVRYQAGEHDQRKKPLHATPAVFASSRWPRHRTVTRAGAKAGESSQAHSTGARDDRGGPGAVLSTGLRAGSRPASGAGGLQTWPRPCRAGQESEGGVTARVLDPKGSDGLGGRRRGPAPRPSQAREWPCTGAGLCLPVSLAKSARRPASISRVVPNSDGRRERTGALGHRRSSEGPEYRLVEHMVLERVGAAGLGRRRARVHRVRWGRPPRSP